MARTKKASRRAEPREAVEGCLLAGEQTENSPTAPFAQVLAWRLSAHAHVAAALESTGAHALGELALGRFYAHQADALARCGESAR